VVNPPPENYSALPKRPGCHHENHQHLYKASDSTEPKSRRLDMQAQRRRENTTTYGYPGIPRAWRVSRGKRQRTRRTGTDWRGIKGTSSRPTWQKRKSPWNV